MKKTYKLQDLDCANCAAKMEAAIGRLDGVSSARVNFMTQKLTIEAEPSNLDSVLDEAQRICSGIEPDCVIVR